jgi:hypothetical protein
MMVHAARRGRVEFFNRRHPQCVPRKSSNRRNETAPSSGSVVKGDFDTVFQNEWRA